MECSKTKCKTCLSDWSVYNSCHKCRCSLCPMCVYKCYKCRKYLCDNCGKFINVKFGDCFNSYHINTVLHVINDIKLI